MAAKPSVLFVCVHNAGRSQMAAALLDHHAHGRVQVHSAGSAPASEINPVVQAVMAELGLDLSREFPKPLTDDAVRTADVVITMGCGDACPVYLGKRYLDWELPDPAGKTLAEVRPLRDEIDHRVCALLEELADHLSTERAERHPQSDFTLAHVDQVTERSVEADARERDGGDGEEREQNGAQPVFCEGIGDLAGKRLDREDGTAGFDLLHLAAERFGHAHRGAMGPHHKDQHRL